MKRLFILLAIVLLIFPYSGNTQESDHDKIEKLEENLKSQQEEIESLKKRLDEMEESNEEDFRALQEGQISFFDTIKGKTHVGGFADAFYADFEDHYPHSEASRFVLILGGKPHPYNRFITEIEFFPKLDEDTGESDVGVKVNVAKGEQVLYDRVAVGGGVILVPFGEYNLNYHDPFRDLVDRPLLATVVIPVSWSDMGFGGTVYVLNTEKWSMDYYIYMVNGLDNRVSSTNEGFMDSRPSLMYNDNGEPAIATRLALKYLERHQLGVSFYTGDYDREENSIEGYDADFKLTFWPLELRGEIAILMIEKGLNYLDEPMPDWVWGSYIEADYHWWPKAAGKGLFGKKFEDPYFTFALRYDRAEIATAPKLYKEDRVTLGFNYRPVENVAIKIQHEWNDGDILHGSQNGFLFGVSAEF